MSEVNTGREGLWRFAVLGEELTFHLQELQRHTEQELININAQWVNDRIHVGLARPANRGGQTGQSSQAHGKGGGQTWLCSGGLEATRVGISVCVWGGHFSLNKLFFGYLIILLCTYLLYFLDLF